MINILNYRNVIFDHNNSKHCFLGIGSEITFIFNYNLYG